MEQSKKEALEKTGWAVGNAEDFLGMNDGKMFIYVFDEKHQNVFGEVEITNIEEAKNIINCLDKSAVTNRYNRLVIAKSWYREYEDEEPRIFFVDQVTDGLIN